jgi:hypothetical protein
MILARSNQRVPVQMLRTKRKYAFLLATLALSTLTSGIAWAVPTEIVVHVLAKDAKFIGSEVGGVKITVSDADTGAVLAQGLTIGGPGTTQAIMKDSHVRRDKLADADTARFSATLDLNQPRRITVTASGPSAVRIAATSVSSTAWVLTGKSVNAGDAWVLELPGFAVGIVDPPAKMNISSTKTIHVHANITMMCGCPIIPGGQWDADKYEFTAQLVSKGKPVSSVPLVYAGKPNQFTGDLDVSDKGQYEVLVTAYDPADGNAGLDKFSIEVQ